MTRETWRLVERNGLRLYSLAPSPSIELLFTTRRTQDEAADHALDLGKQLEFLGRNSGLVTMHQTHSVQVVRVDVAGEVEADGCFTAEPNLALSVRVADCVPLFFWDKDSTLVGLAHAGWRATLSKIALKFVEKVEMELGISPSRLSYAIGPAIGGCCYRVGEELREAFRSFGPEADRFFTKSSKALYLDLRSANRFLLSCLGVTEYASLDLCTHCESKLFYSYRRERGAGWNWGIITRFSKA